MEIAKQLIKIGANDWKHSIECACLNKNIELIKLLIGHNMNHLNCCLFDVCLVGNHDIIQLLTNNGVYDWNYGLYGANVEVVKQSIKKGVSDWNNGLYYACYGIHVVGDILELIYY